MNFFDYRINSLKMVIPLAGLYGLFVVSQLGYYVAFQWEKRNAEDVAMAMEYCFEWTNEIFGEHVTFDIILIIIRLYFFCNFSYKGQLFIQKKNKSNM